MALAGSIVALFAAACTPRGEVVSEGEYLVFDPIGVGQLGAIMDTTEWVIRDSLEWERVKGDFEPREPFRRVNFRQAMVVAIALPQASGGFNVEVESVERTADAVVVEYAVQVPSSDCILAAGASLPFQVVQVRRSDEPVRFVRRNDRYRCTWRH